MSENQFGTYGRTTLAWQLTDTLKVTEAFSAALATGNDSFLSNTSLTTDVYGNFALRLSVCAEYETRPPPDRKKLDTFSKASVVYVFQPP